MSQEGKQLQDLLYLLGGEEDVLRFWPQLDERQRDALANQIKSLDVSACRAAFSASAHLSVPSRSEILPFGSDRHLFEPNFSAEERRRLFNIGLGAIARGEVAALVLAGGQASRLGSALPKGTLPLGLQLTPKDSLLCLQAARLARLQAMAAEAFPNEKNSGITWVVMTSASTASTTLKHLEEIMEANGLDKNQMITFSQDEIPAFDFEGKFLLDRKDHITTSPNGNGGVYSSLAPHMPTLHSKGVKYVHVYCVDNILVKVADPLSVGLAYDKEADVIIKAVKREKPEEKVGVICSVRGVPTVVEYSELGEDLSAARDEAGSGELAYRAGNIANHLFSLDFLDSFVKRDFHLPYHRAIKKIPYIDSEGALMKPSEPNGVKLEQFVFDVFPMAKNFFILEVDRNEEFSPLKNPDSTGAECMSTCKADIRALHRKWLMKAGAAKLPEEILVHPSRSYGGENLESFDGKEFADGVVV